MPIKRRHSKRRTFTISPEAVARWREVGPGAVGWNHVADDMLALRAELEAGGRDAD